MATVKEIAMAKKALNDKTRYFLCAVPILFVVSGLFNSLAFTVVGDLSEQKVIDPKVAKELQTGIPYRTGIYIVK